MLKSTYNLLESLYQVSLAYMFPSDLTIPSNPMVLQIEKHMGDEQGLKQHHCRSDPEKDLNETAGTRSRELTLQKMISREMPLFG